MQLGRCTRAVAAVVGAIALAAPGGAAGAGQGQAGTAGAAAQQGASGRGSTTGQQSGQQPGRVLDVEELNDQVQRHVGRRVAVAGEIKQWLDARSFVLESGGIFDDEITVVVPKDAKGIQVSALAQDADVVVTGTVRQASLVEVERELGWDLRPELEIEFTRTRTFLVADQIARQQDGRAAQRGTGAASGSGSGSGVEPEGGDGWQGDAAVGDFSDTGATPGSPSEPRKEQGQP